MKPTRNANRTRHEQGLTPRRDDSYRDAQRAPDPAACPRCRASYARGRWTWQPAAPDAQQQLCPACQRLEANQPAGYVTLDGPFLAAHREEIVAMVTARAERARVEHPLQRIIGMQETDGGGVLVTTTDSHLAGAIGIALQAAYKGELDLAFSQGENFVRVTWSR